MNRAVLVLLLACLGWQNASAIDCAEFNVSPSGTRCEIRFIIPWTGFGGPYEYIWKVQNVKMDSTTPVATLRRDGTFGDLKGKVNVRLTSLTTGWDIPK